MFKESADNGKKEEEKKVQVAKKVVMSPEVEYRYQLLLAKKTRGGK